jgi:AraC-like DNA-binding protein
MFSQPRPDHHHAVFDGTTSVLAARPAVAELERRGIDAGAALAEARLSRDDLARDDGRLPHRSVRDLWEAAARAAGDRWFGVHVVERLPVGSVGLLDYLVASAETVGEGLTIAAKYLRLLDDRAEWRLDGARLCCRVTVPAPQLDEAALAWVVTRSRDAAGTRWLPERIVLQHERPGDDRELARVFGCPVGFGGAETEVRISPALLERRHARADARLREVLERAADAQIGALPERDDLVSWVSAAIARQLAHAVPDLTATASAVRLPERTLQRRLAEQGLSHSALVDDVRRELALHYLNQTPLTVYAIAERLQFADATAFHRAFRRWTGAAPAEYRRGHRPGNRCSSHFEEVSA